MRKIILTLLVAVCCLAANAQQERWAVGLGAAYSVADGSTGFGLKAQYDLPRNMRLEAGFTYQKGDDSYLGYTERWTTMDFSANIHYMFRPAACVVVYPLTGVSFVSTRSKDSFLGDDNYLDVAYNVGCGAQYLFTNRLSVYAESRGIYIGDDLLEDVNLSVGLIYHF